MFVSETDLTSYARIRNAALDGFAKNGVAGTSIRDVAAAAGVSPGLVQHHFKTKPELRKAVNEHVLAIVSEAFADLSTAPPSRELLEELAQRVTDVVREHRTALLYVARSAVEGDEDALRLFDAFVELGRSQFERFADAGLMREHADLVWAPLQLVLLDFGAILLEHAVNRHLPEPFAEGLDRWHRAATDLFACGVFKFQPDAPTPKKRSSRKPTRA
jgi:AcrR family transcriptional regulator